MKRIYTVLVALLLTASVFLPQQVSAQAPEKISYQAVIRNASNNLVTDTEVSMQISILQGSATGTSVYVETHKQSSNANGLVSLGIGTGTTTDDFSTIDWSADIYFIKTETDPAGGTNYNITGVSQLLSVPYALHAKTAETVTGTKYHVGDFVQGGIVFWLDKTGEHGLVCVKEDQNGGSKIRWHAGTNGATQAKGNGPYAGELNTSIIISSQVSIGDDGDTYAARLCNELQITEGGKTYGDWYLPSKQELNLMYLNKSTIVATAKANSGTGFAVSAYWSSTESNNSKAWWISFANGFQHDGTKSTIASVRAVRAF